MVCHRFGALNAYNFTANIFEQYQLEPEDVGKKLNDQWIAIDKDVNGNIWLGSRNNGCYVFDTAAKKFYNLRYDVFDPGSLSDNTVNCLYRDKTGILWLGTNKGICKYDPLASQVKYHHIKDEKRPGLAKLNIMIFMKPMMVLSGLRPMAGYSYAIKMLWILPANTRLSE
jgi:hypothetical protein